MVKKTAKPANKKSASLKKKLVSTAKKPVKKTVPARRNQKPVRLKLDMLFTDPLKQAAKASARKKMQ